MRDDIGGLESGLSGLPYGGAGALGGAFDAGDTDDGADCAGAVVGWGRDLGRQRFFLKKKNPFKSKVFCVFFSKKKRFPFPLRLANPPK